LKKALVFHPFLFTLYAILAPMAGNVSNLRLGTIRTLISSLLFVIALTLFMRWRIKDKVKAGLLSSGIILPVFLYGHVETFLSDRIGSYLVLDLLVLLLFGVLLGLYVYWVMRKIQDAGLLNTYFNVVGLILIIFPLYSIFTYTRYTEDVSHLAAQVKQLDWQENGVANLQPAIPPAHGKPDIYYIIVDGYTRADVLQELYGYDNTEFIEALRARGFYVAQSSRSNYTDTVFSIASSLNMSHIHTTAEFTHRAANVTNQEVFKRILSSNLIAQNRVAAFLKEQGYSSVYFDSGYERLRFASADHYEYSPNVSRSNQQAAFELMLLDTTIGKLYFKLRGKDYTPLQSMYDDHREQILYALDNLPNYAQKEGSYFLYAHIISPHTPYVFGPNGEPRASSDPYTLLDTKTSDKWTPELYRDQVIYINKRILGVIDEILARSDTDPIIILQADHSSRSYNVRDKSDDLRMKLLLPILNAYRLPGVAADRVLYPTITPVNSFRVLFYQYFGTTLPMLEGTSYIYENADGFKDFVNACQVYQACESR